MFGSKKKIKVVNKQSNSERYNNGDIFEIAILTNNNDVYIDMNGETPLWLIDGEWVFHEEVCPRCFGSGFRNNGYNSYPCNCTIESILFKRNL